MKTIGASQAARLLGMLLTMLMVVACAAQAPVSAPPTDAQARKAEPARNPTATASPSRAGQQQVDTKVEVFAAGVLLPAALTFAPDGRLFFAEVNAGRIRVVRAAQLQPEPFATLPVLQATESGLLGLALDPDFTDNHFVYAYFSDAEPASGVGLRNRVVRFTDRDGRGVELTPIVETLPGSQSGGVDAHQGGAMAFGPDGKLYVGVGDTGNGQLAQDGASLAGKILRLNRDGSVPSDNPSPGSPVFASGFRNPWGLAFHPRTGQLFATDNGNKSHDEVNLVVAGGNYGWPLVEGKGRDRRFIDPIWDSGTGGNSRNGMVGLTAYSGSLFPELQDNVLFCSFKTGRIRRLTLKPPAYTEPGGVAPLAGDCRLGITVGPDSAIYVSTINQVLRLTR